MDTVSINSLFPHLAQACPALILVSKSFLLFVGLVHCPLFGRKTPVQNQVSSLACDATSTSVHRDAAPLQHIQNSFLYRCPPRHRNPETVRIFPRLFPSTNSGPQQWNFPVVTFGVRLLLRRMPSARGFVSSQGRQGVTVRLPYLRSKLAPFRELTITPTTGACDPETTVDGVCPSRLFLGISPHKNCDRIRGATYVCCAILEGQR